MANVIEDALDLSRVENNKFEIHREDVNIRQILNELKGIMDFQVEKKNLYFKVFIAESVPTIVRIDPKRYK